MELTFHNWYDSKKQSCQILVYEKNNERDEGSRYRLSSRILSFSVPLLLYQKITKYQQPFAGLLFYGNDGQVFSHVLKVRVVLFIKNM